MLTTLYTIVSSDISFLLSTISIIIATGQFAYLLSNNSPDDLLAVLRSPKAMGEMCLYFYYQMFGSKSPHIGVFVSKDEASFGENIWNVTNEVSAWNLAWVEIAEAETFQVVIGAYVEKDSISDIAVDDLNMVNGKCSVSEEDNKCDFETGLCHYYNYQHDDQLDWIIHTPSDPQLGDVPPGNGFIYVGLTHEFSMEDFARISSPKFNFNTTGRICVDFFYYFSDGPSSEIHAYTGHLDGDALLLEEVGKVSGGPAKTWRRFRKNVEISEAEFLLIFDGKLKKNDTIVALDRIFVTEGGCPNPMFCDFEDMDLCGYMNQQSNNYDWMVAKGNDDSTGWTKPDVDHTQGTEDGGFAFVNPGKFDPGMSASLVTPQIGKYDKERCFKFWTHFYGKSVGTLDVFLMHKDYTELIWHVEDDKMPNEWVESQVSYFAVDNHHLHIIATTTSNSEGDIALDDLNLRNENCEILPDFAGSNSNYSDPTTTTTQTTPTTTVSTTIKADTTQEQTTTIATTTTTTPEPENQYNCDFAEDFCDWQPGEMNEGHDWQLKAGFFAFFTFNNEIENFHLSSLVSYPHSASSAVCLKFKYLLFGGDTGQLNVKVQDAVNSSQVVHIWRANSETIHYSLQSINIHSDTNFRIMIEAEKLKDSYGYIRIDDIVVEENECQSDEKSVECNFESSNQCGYHNVPLNSRGAGHWGNIPAWILGSGISNNGNGPDDDHDMGTSVGHYFYLDGNFDVSSITYMGCYTDTSDRLLDVLKYQSNDNSVEKCVEECGKEKYSFAGVQNK